jgi:hypothetical protein
MFSHRRFVFQSSVCVLMGALSVSSHAKLGTYEIARMSSRRFSHQA